MTRPVIHLEYPAWVDQVARIGDRYASDIDRMRLAVEIARRNVDEGTGGPFGAAVFESVTGRLVSVGMNSVVRGNNCTLHGEMVAFMMAQHALRSFTLAAPGMPAHEIATSCAPCAMCLGAVLWSGVKRMLCGAAREDASALNFDEGPVFPESYAYLEARGITIVHDVLRAEARAVLERYRANSGAIYNA